MWSLARNVSPKCSNEKIIVMKNYKEIQNILKNVANNNSNLSLVDTNLGISIIGFENSQEIDKIKKDLKDSLKNCSEKCRNEKKKEEDQSENKQEKLLKMEKL